MSQVSSKMTEDNDLLILNRVKQQRQRKSKRNQTDREQLSQRQAFGDAYRSKITHKDRKNKQYKFKMTNGISNGHGKGSLFNLPKPSPIKQKYQTRNTGGRHRKRLKKTAHNKQYYNPKTSILNDIPASNDHSMSMTRNGEILVSNLGRKQYENLMEVKTKEAKKKVLQVGGYWNELCADFVKETHEKILNTVIDITAIDLTSDNDTDDDDQGNHIAAIQSDDDIELLSNDRDYNGNKNKNNKNDVIVIDDEDDDTSPYVYIFNKNSHFVFC